MSHNKDAAERAASIAAAGDHLVKALYPARGYSPGTIGKQFADAIMRAVNQSDIEEDLGHECSEMILSAAIARLNEHYERINRNASAQMDRANKKK
jgi:hypothetical protein